MTSGEEGSSDWQLKLEKVLQRVKRMAKDSTGSVQETVQQEGTFQPGDEMAEKTSLTSGRKWISRDYYFFPYFSVQESQGVSRSDGGRLKTSGRR